MDYTTLLTCEYLFDNNQCIIYLTSHNIEPKQYECVYNLQVNNELGLKKIRKLRCLQHCDLNPYPNLLMVIFDDMFNNKITSFPNTLTHIIFEGDSHFTKNLPRLPPRLMHLELGSQYNKPILYLPSTLLYLDLGFHFNKRLPPLPKNLEYFYTGEYNHKFIVSSKLKYLIVGSNYKHKISQLPNTLLHLILSDEYNKVLPPLPDSIIYLGLGWNYNHKYPALPKSLQRLRVFAPNTPLPRLPDSITHLDLQGECQYELPNVPKNLKHLIMADIYEHKIKLPKTLTRLVTSIGKYCSISWLPNNITHLTWRAEHDIPSLPKSLRHLYIRSDIKTKNLVLPDNLRHLHITKCCIPDILPNNLECLLLGDDFNHEINKLPINLKRLMIGHKFNKKIPPLPPNLKYLELCNMFDDVNFDIPNHILYLWIGLECNDKVGDMVIKSNQKTNRSNKIKQSCKFTFPVIPPSVTHLKLRTHAKLNMIPNNVKQLVCTYNQPLPELHDKLEHIEIDCDYEYRFGPKSSIKTIKVWYWYKYISDLYERYGNKVSYLRNDINSRYNQLYGYEADFIDPYGITTNCTISSV
jgi:hypothetical protein